MSHNSRIDSHVRIQTYSVLSEGRHSKYYQVCNDLEQPKLKVDSTIGRES